MLPCDELANKNSVVVWFGNVEQGWQIINRLWNIVNAWEYETWEITEGQIHKNKLFNPLLHLQFAMHIKSIGHLLGNNVVLPSIYKIDPNMF